MAAGFESGHAYGKAVRTVKSCVGSTWCRFGVQDSVGLAIALELRYRGLRAPHKIKLGVSGCARECAEALMLYVRTADRLQRTAAWLEEYEGGLDALRAVVVEDSLGICAELDRGMADHVAGYSDEWRDTLQDPERPRHFDAFVNAPQLPDPSLAYVAECGQARPATARERDDPAVLVAGTTLEVRR